MAEFKAWPQVSNLTDEVTVTEMIDGAGAFAIHIERLKFNQATGEITIRAGDVIDYESGEMAFYRLTAQSRTRLITPKDDTQGFAKWVADNSSGLVSALGEGIHYGEWWGYKINRGYGLPKGDKRFSLYNTERWTHLDGKQVPGLYCVPVLDSGSLFQDTWSSLKTPVHIAVDILRQSGSQAAPGFKDPEGVVVFHTGGRVMFKYRFDEDGPDDVSPFTHLKQYPGLRTREEQDEELTQLEETSRVVSNAVRDINKVPSAYWENLT